jgi:transcriptional regulator
MYIPRAFAVEDFAALRELIHDHSFATLITAADGAPVATHLPLLLEERGEQGVLMGHLARANPQWRAFDGQTEALVIFSGPHGYVSPSWYEAQPSVPTWNYMVAHVYGAPRVLEDEAAVQRHLLALVARFESGRPRPYDTPYEEDWLRRMIQGVVAFELPIARIEGKFKLSQNRGEADRAHVAAEFAASEDPDERAMAAAMRALGIAPLA